MADEFDSSGGGEQTTNAWASIMPPSTPATPEVSQSMARWMKFSDWASKNPMALSDPMFARIGQNLRAQAGVAEAARQHAETLATKAWENSIMGAAYKAHLERAQLMEKADPVAFNEMAAMPEPQQRIFAAKWNVAYTAQEAARKAEAERIAATESARMNADLSSQSEYKRESAVLGKMIEQRDLGLPAPKEFAVPGTDSTAAWKAAIADQERKIAGLAGKGDIAKPLRKVTGPRGPGTVPEGTPLPPGWKYVE